MSGTVLFQTPDNLLDGACMYAAAADAVNDRHPEAWFVVNQLLGMSIELALKAYLQRRGYDDRTLRKLGHNHKKLFDEAVEKGLRYTDSRNFRILMHGQHYKDRLFAYPTLEMLQQETLCGLPFEPLMRRSPQQAMRASRMRLFPMTSSPHWRSRCEGQLLNRLCAHWRIVRPSTAT